MNDMSIGGMMSGLDTNAVVDSMVKQSKAPIQKYQNKIDIKTLEKTLYQEINDSLGDLKGDLLRFNLEATFDTKKTNISDDSVAKISAGPMADTGSYDIQILEKAKSASAVSSFKVEKDKVLAESVEGKGVKSGTFSINSTSIYIDAEKDSLEDVVDKINNAEVGARLVYDSFNGKLTLLSDDINKISVGGEDDTSNFLEIAGLIDDMTQETEIGEEGTSAYLIVDGIEYTRETNKIEDILEGVTIEIKNPSDKTVTIDIDVDNAKTVDAMAEFIQGYNQVIEELNYKRLTDEDKEYLQPLTEEDRASMTDKEIDEYKEKWAEVNKNEIKRKSNEMRMLQDDLRRNVLSVSGEIDGEYSSLTDIGISYVVSEDYTTTDNKYLLTKSTDIDEIKEGLEKNSKFMEALSENSKDIYAFFAQKNEDAEGWADNFRSSIDLYSSTNGVVLNKIKREGSIDKEIQNLSKQIDTAETRANNELERLWRQFSVMEESMGQLQSQGDYLTQMIASQNSMK